MSGSIDYKTLYEEELRKREEEQRRREEEQRRREEEQRRREEEQRRREEEQRRRQEAEKARNEAENKVKPTTLPQFLDACHIHLQAGLAVQSEDLSTKGDPSNARRKKRPNNVREWVDFLPGQFDVCKELVGSDFMTQGYFTSLHTMLENGQRIRRRMMGSELDVHHFQRSTVEENVAMIVEHIAKDEVLRNKFGLKGSVQFENHANTLSPEDALSEDLRAVSLSGRGRRRSPRLLEKARNELNPSRPRSPGTGPAIQAKTSRPRADQFCVYNVSANPGREERVPAFIVEYKAPHKLTLQALKEGLREMEMEDILDDRDDETPRRKYQRLVAAAVTQAFSYMVSAGLEFGYVCTGQAFIFLQVPEDPTTVRYFLSVPNADVGESTGWSDEEASRLHNRLHLTAVAQVLAFTLRALQSPPRSHKWRAEADDLLATWEFTYTEILDAAPAPEATPSEHHPSPGNMATRVSPINLRKASSSRSQFACRPESGDRGGQDSEPDEGGPDTPSQPFQKGATSTTDAPSGSRQVSKGARQEGRGQKGQRTRSFCTKRCLLGLVGDGNLDRKCPNVSEHGTTTHCINKATFLAMMRDQLSRTLDEDFEPCGRPGSRGVPFKAVLARYGYTVIAKCTPADFADHLRHEAAVYEHMQVIQGIHVTTHLGDLELQRPYYYEGIAKLVHVMFLGYVGEPISRYWNCLDQPSVLLKIEKCMNAIHDFGVLHRDIMPRNILWNCNSAEVTVIDFERAMIAPARPVLGTLPVNRKRRQSDNLHDGKQIVPKVTSFVQEMAQMRHEISCL